MRILIDECIDERLRHMFPAFDCQSARYAGFAGLKNGDLLTAAEAAGFDVIITVDQNMPSQQKLADRSLSVMVFCAPTNRLGHLQRLIPAALGALGSITPGDLVRIEWHPSPLH